MLHRVATPCRPDRRRAPRQAPVPVRKAPRSETPSPPWLPPGVGTLLPRLALGVALLAIPVAAAFGLQFWLARAHVAYDGNLLLAEGGADEVTALYWSPSNGALYVGTRSGSAKRITTSGAVDEILSPRNIDAADGDAVSPVQSFHLLQEWPVVVYQNRLDPSANGQADAFAATQITSGLFSIAGGLFASVEANNGSAVVGRAA